MFLFQIDGHRGHVVHTFWRHPIGCSNHCLSFTVFLCDGRAKSEICNFNRPVHPQQHVIRLDIAMNHVSLMEKLKKNNFDITGLFEVILRLFGVILGLFWGYFGVILRLF